MDANIVKLLFTYGPFALLVLFIFVVEARVRGSLKDTSVPQGISRPIYAVTWVVIFALCVSVVYIWFLFNVTNEATIFGTFSNISASQSVSSRYNLYLHRSYTTGDSFDYDWRLVTPRRLSDGTKVDFDFATSPTAIPTRHEFMVDSSFYESPVAIRYITKTQKLRLEHAGKTEDLLPLDDQTRIAAPVLSAPGFSLIPTVLAAGAQSQAAQSRVTQMASRETLYQRLDAVDPVIRREARDELAARGRTELGQLEQVLVAERSSTRLRVSVLSGVNRMKDTNGDAFSEATYQFVLKSVSDPDSSLADESYRFLARYSVAGAANVNPDRGRVSVPVKGTEANRGDFVFDFRLSRQGPSQVRVELRDVNVQVDSSTTAARWIFTVVGNQHQAFQLSRPSAADHPSGVVPGAQGQELALRIAGYMSKTIQSLPRVSVRRPQAR